MTRLSLAVLALLASPVALRAQDSLLLAMGSPLLAEFAVSSGFMSGGRNFPVGVGLSVGFSLVGLPQQRGYRLGVAATSSHMDGPRPTDPGRVNIHSRSIDVVSLERLRLRQRGRRIITTGYGAGVGVMSYYREGQRAHPIVKGKAAALTGSADIAYRLPFTGEGMAKPTDLFAGLRSSLLFGVPFVGRSVPATGEIPTRRGIGSTFQVSLGMRVGLFSDFFSH
jgi:hypothetical protein